MRWIVVCAVIASRHRASKDGLWRRGDPGDRRAPFRSLNRPHRARSWTMPGVSTGSRRAPWPLRPPGKSAARSWKGSKPARNGQIAWAAPSPPPQPASASLQAAPASSTRRLRDSVGQRAV